MWKTDIQKKFYVVEPLRGEEGEVKPPEPKRETLTNYKV